MWLRDFLPEPRPSLHPGLAQLRVMTFGYSSLVRDKKNTASLHEWSSELLQSVSAVRRSPSVCTFSRFGLFAHHVLAEQNLGAVSSHNIRLSLARGNCCAPGVLFWEHGLDPRTNPSGCRR